MVNLSLHNGEIRIKASDEILSQVEEYFSPHTEGYFFSPKFKKGTWDGKIRFFNKYRCTVSVRLYDELIRCLEKQEIELDDINISEELHALLTASIDETFDFSITGPYSLRDYQEASSCALMKNRGGLAVVATGGGKAFGIISYIAGLIRKHGKMKILIIVPRKQLVEQFYKEFLQVGWFKTKDLKGITVGKLYGEAKDGLNTDICVSTWQTLSHMTPEFSQSFQAVVVDEVQSAKGVELREILSQMTAEYRAGFTGTLPKNRADLLTIKSLLGDVVYHKPASELQDEGILSPITIKQFVLKYAMLEQVEMNYVEESCALVAHAGRNKFISAIAKAEAQKGNVLILVEKIEHGNILTKLTDGVFVQGATPIKQREALRESVEELSGAIIIATYGVFSMGINMKKLHTIIFASSGKSEIRVVQSIGRGLRTADGKNQLTLIDIADYIEYSKDHAAKRRSIYKQQKFLYKKIVLPDDFLKKYDIM